MVKASLAPAGAAPSHSLPCVKGGGERSEPEGLLTQTMPGFISPSALRSHRRVMACTARRRGVPFVRTRRRGLRSMSGHPAYAWGNPPTLRRSSFPQRASRPAGGPIPKHTWGCAPSPPNAQAAAGYERCKHRPYGAADTLSRCLRRIFMWGSAETKLK